MSQAEIAGGQVTAQGELPAKGHRLRDFELMSRDGHRIRLSDYRGRRNLVLVFADEQQATADLLSAMASRYQEFKNWDAEIVVIVQLTSERGGRTKPRLNLPFPVLLDEDGRIHHQVGASDPSGHVAAAVYVTDRYGEVFGAYRTRDSQSLPAVDEVLNWLEFVSSQCPECEPPEWPL
ncbi:MAG: redoxin domain-containing protein [Terriglobales bacterium]